MTKFEQVTESPKTLAKFIEEITEHCICDTQEACKTCPVFCDEISCDASGVEKALSKEVVEKKKHVVTVEVTDDMSVADIIRAILADADNDKK